MKSWILVANSSQAKIFESENLRNKELKLLRDIEHPESREKGSDLISDRPGHYQTSHMARSAYEKNDPKDVAAENFAIEVAGLLQDGHNKNKYEQLVIVSAPQFYGLLNKHMHFTAKNSEHISKDYTKCTEQELSQHLYQQLCELK